MSKTVTFKNQNNQKLVGILHMPRRGKGPYPAVVVGHGLSSSKDSTYRKDLCDRLARNEIVALRFDLAGHGDSQGKFRDVTVSQGIEDIKSAINFVKSLEEVDPSRIGIWGCSLSGNQAAYVAASDKKIKAIALFAPAIDFAEIAKLRWPQEIFNKWKKTGALNYKPGHTLNYSFHLDSVKRKAYKAADKIKAATLVIHGSKDDVVPVNQSKEFYKLLTCTKKLEIILNGDHRISRKPWKDRVVNKSVAWFHKYL